MNRTEWIVLGCTAALMATLIGCTWALKREMSTDATYILRDLEGRG